MYKFLEELSLNQWPALSVHLYDGWLLRFANGYTKRANSVSPLYSGRLDPQNKIAVCEAWYAERQLPAIFKITPFTEPSNLDALLHNRGYSCLDYSSVRSLDLSNLPGRQADHLTAFHIRETMTSEWLEHYIRLSGCAPRHQTTMAAMLSGYAGKQGFIALVEPKRQQPIAMGLGVIERSCIGLYDIVTDAAERNKGYGEQLVRRLLDWGKRSGAATAYLAVLNHNAAASRLYDKLGFEERYAYWYRIKSFL